MEAEHRVSRRTFLEVGGASLLLPVAGWSQSSETDAPLRMGVLADLHHGLEPRAMPRLDAFMRAVDERKPDCLLQLGDFTYGTDDSAECMRLWEQFRGPSYHVLGNHDMDFTTKRSMLDLWSMPAPYYSFDLGGYHFVVLDRNNLKTPDGHVAYADGNYFVDPALRGHADPEQLEWLRADLAATRLRTVVFAHQGLGMQNEAYPAGDARGTIEAILDQANGDTGPPKVVACFCGHHHLDRHNLKRGIHYVWLNSASYFWLGDRQRPTYETRYGPMAPYRDALFAFLAFHPDGLIEIEGRRSEWDYPSPSERGYAETDVLTPYISDRRLRAGAAGIIEYDRRDQGNPDRLRQGYGGPPTSLRRGYSGGGWRGLAEAKQRTRQ